MSINIILKYNISRISMYYELTLTLRPWLYVHTPQEQYKLLSCVLDNVLANTKISLVVELTSEHNLHAHALLELPDISAKDKFLNKFRTQSVSKYIGRKSCNQVQYFESYIRYMRKDLNKTIQVISDPIYRDDYGILTMFYNYLDTEDQTEYPELP